MSLGGWFSGSKSTDHFQFVLSQLLENKKVSSQMFVWNYACYHASCRMVMDFNPLQL